MFACRSNVISSNAISSNVTGALFAPQRAPRRVNGFRCLASQKDVRRSQVAPAPTALRTALNGCMPILAACLLLAPVQPATASPTARTGDPAALLVELQEAELPALQSNVSKIIDPAVSSDVEKKLSTIQIEVANLAEGYDQGKIRPNGLISKENRIMRSISSLKSEMRAHE